MKQVAAGSGEYWLAGMGLAAATGAKAAEGPLAMGSRRELFVDQQQIESLRGATLQLGVPTAQEVVLKMDRPHEGPFSAYFTVLHDEEQKGAARYRLYYRGVPDAGKDGRAGETTCYAEAEDGIHFTKPADNILLQGQPPYSHNFCPFLDRNPKGGSRYKALSGIASSGLRAWQSDDGLRWRPMREEPVMPATKLPMFDSQNLAFWSQSEGCYVAYVRQFRNGIRSIVRTTSADFLQWSPYEALDLDGPPEDHLYTNQLHPYYRAPHLYVGIAARFQPGRQVLTEEEAKQIGVHPKYFQDTSDSVLLTTRGGNHVARTFRESFLRPGPAIANWVSRDNYPALHIVPTGTEEMSFYVNRHYGQPTAHLQRFSLRLDGLASLRAGWRGGELLTKPFTFTGKELELNFSTSAAGGIRVEMQRAEGSGEGTGAVAGLQLADCRELIGDRTAKRVTWKGGNVAQLQGTPVRMLLTLRDADVYSYRFTD